MGLGKNKRWVIGGCTLAVVAGVFFGVYWLTSFHVPGERQMARILADIYTADALLQDYVTKGKNDKTLEQAYHTILSHYGLTKAEYDSAMNWYSANSQELVAVYDRMIAILSEREQYISEIATRKDSTERAVVQLNDSLRNNIGKWPTAIRLPIPTKVDTIKRYLRPSETDYDRIVFSFPLDSIVGGKITLMHKYTLFGKEINVRDSVNVILSVALADSTTTCDTARYLARRTMTQREAEVTVWLPDDVAATEVTATFMQIEKMHTANVTIKDINLFHKPYDVVDTTYNDFELPPLFNY